MTPDFIIGQGDMMPILIGTLEGSDGSLVSLVTVPAPTVKFSLHRYGYGTVKINEAAAIIQNDTLSIVEYQWTTSDTDTPGLYAGYWVVIYGDGSRVQVPTGRRLLISVVAK